MQNKKIYIEYWWLILIATITIFRLIITGDRDILALNMPHDDFWYINTALHKIWGSKYNHMSFIHLPIYSAWLYFLKLFGIPVRLGIDVAWLVASGYLAFAIYRLTRRGWLVALLFSFLVFHPYTISFFDRTLAETFLAVVSAAVIGAGIELWNCRDGGSASRRTAALLIYVLGFAIAFHTRKEGIVLLAPLLVLVCWSLFDRRNWWMGSSKQTLAISLLLAPVLATIFLGVMLAGANYLKWGVWTRYELAAPGYQRAIAALNHIDVGRTPRHFTVTKDVLSLAYKESPTFRELQPFMEGSAGQMWLSISSQATGIPGEIGNGWFYWALRDVASRASWHSDAKLAESKYSSVADELDKAFAAGRLKKHVFTIFSFLDPDIGKWMPAVPGSVFNVLQLVLRPSPQNLYLPTENASAIQFEQSVVITGRRRLASNRSGVIVGVNGWTIMPAGTLVGLGKDNTIFSWTRLSGPQRSDVPGAYAFIVSADSFEPPNELHIMTPDGKKGSVELSVLRAQSTSTFTGEIQAELGVDSLKFSMIRGADRADRWLSMSKLCIVYKWIGYVFCLAAAAGIIGEVVRKKALSAPVVILVLIIAAITSRVALFGLLDASSWNGIQARYMLPIIPAFACMGVFGLSLVSDLARKAKPDLEAP